MSKYCCPKCRQGVLRPVVLDEHETELSETFICSNCQHQAKIPAAMIIFSQVLTSVVGGVVTAYLFIEQLSAFVTIIQFGIDANLTKNVSLLIIALLFLIGFGYTLFIGLQGFARRQLYLNAGHCITKVTDPTDSTTNSG